MSNSDWLTFSADIVEHFLLFYYGLKHECSIFVDWQEIDETLLHCIRKNIVSFYIFPHFYEKIFACLQQNVKNVQRTSSYHSS